MERKKAPSGHEYEVPLRITVIAPTPGVQFCLQGRAGQPINQTRSKGEDLVFNLTVRVGEGNGAMPRLLGPFTQGPPAQRFIYF